ncbi:MAG: hypothetical protein QW046_04625 [Candidatus Micrarchaeaceae archaeon]
MDAKRFIVVAIALLALQIIASANGFFPQSNVIGRVSVVCPFSVTLNMSQNYAPLRNITANYTLKTIAPCNLTNATGYFTIYNSTNISVFYKPIIYKGRINNISSPPSNISISVSNLTSANYSAVLKFTSMNYTNFSKRSFRILGTPPNLILRTFSSSGPTNQYSTEGFFVSIENIGDFASQNATLAITITGPANYTLNYTVQALAPGQFSNKSISVGSPITSVPGYYTATAKVYYFVNGIKKVSNALSASYGVFSPTPKPVPKPTVTPIPQFSLTSFPYLVTAAQGTMQSSYLGISDTAGVPEQILVSVPPEYSQLVSLSTNSITLSPGGSASISLLLSAPKGFFGSFTIPINITARIANSTYSATDYMTYSISRYNMTSSIASVQVTLTNATKNAQGVIEISNPTNANLTNAVFETTLPEFVTSSIGNLKAYGMPNNVSIVNGLYTIKWFISSLPKGQSAYAYYSIANVSNPTLLTRFQNVLTAPSLPKPSSILRLLSISSPTFYTNSTASISMNLLYTGTAPQQVFFAVTAPYGISVPKPSFYINATPNEFITLSIPIVTTSATGTFMVSIFASTAGANITSSLPILVLPALPKPTTTVPQTTTVPAISLPPISAPTILIFSFISVIILGAAIAYTARRVRNRPRYDNERLAHALRIRERIKRSGENE